MKKLIAMVLTLCVLLTLFAGCGAGGKSSISVGDIMTFGEYEWLVLDVQKNKVLIITKSVIDLRSYNEKFENTTWENCTLRQWLNGEFYDQFSNTDKSKILETEVLNSNNPDYGTDGGNDTKDKVFLLSIDEANQYFEDDWARVAVREMTQAQIEAAAWRILRNPATTGYADNYSYDDLVEAIQTWRGSWYWLRSPGVANNVAARVNEDGSVATYGPYAVINTDYEGSGVRPAMWITIK